MFNTARNIKVGVAWMTIAYVICFAVVGLMPATREWFFAYALHYDFELVGRTDVTAANFIAGLVWWDVLVALGIWLWGALWNRIKK